VQGHGSPNPTYVPEGHAAMEALARRLAEATGDYAAAGGSWFEVFDVPMTAHFLGGVAIGSSPDRGVVDGYHRVWGHPGICVVDGSAVAANLGVNPALTITAQAERALSLWPNAGDADTRPSQTELLEGPGYAVLPAVAPRRPAVPGFLRTSGTAPSAGPPRPPVHVPAPRVRVSVADATLGA
jgi:cholesterol oxidase